MSYLSVLTRLSPYTRASLSSHPCLSVLVPSCLAGQAGALGSSGSQNVAKQRAIQTIKEVLVILMDDC